MKRRFLAHLRKHPHAYDMIRNIYSTFVLPFVPPPQTVQERIEAILGRKASVFFVQVGSNDGVHGDPIHGLIDQHETWSGIFIEPVRFLFERLQENYKHAERFTFVNKAVAHEKGVITFYYVSQNAKAALDNALPSWYDQLGSFNKDHILKHLGGILAPYIIEEEIESATLQDIIDEHGVQQIDLLHIDTEGFDYEVLSQVNFNRYQPHLILYEHRHLSAQDKDKSQTLLRRSGYKCFEYDGDTMAIFNR